MTLHDYPNLEVLGLDPPWVEGTGGSEGEPTPQAEKRRTKAELLDELEAKGVDADPSLTKAELEEALEEAG